MFIGFVLHHTGTVEHPPVWGEEVQARLMSKELELLGVETQIINKNEEFRRLPDVSFHFSSDITIKKGKVRVLWVQNDWDFRKIDLDINQFNNQYDLILHASDILYQKHKDSFNTSFFRMPGDPSLYFPTKPSGRFPEVDIVYVSNNIKTYLNDSYIRPLVDHFGPDRFRIYGSVWEGSGFEHCWGGAPPGLVVPDIFASAKIILSLHMEDHRKYNVTTCRIPEALLSGKPIISDKVGVEVFKDFVTYCSSEDLVLTAVNLLQDYYSVAEARALKGRHFILENHTFTHRVKELLTYIERLI